MRPSAALVLAASACFIQQPHDTGPSGDWERWDGWQTYQFGTGATVTDLQCAYEWDVVGTPSNARCPDCLLVFNISMSTVQSQDDGGCMGHVPSTSGLTLGYLEDHEGRGPHLVEIDSEGARSAYAQAAFDEEGGTLQYSYGNFGLVAGAEYTVDWLEGGATIE